MIFPAIATVLAYAIIYILTSAVVDSFSGPGLYISRLHDPRSYPCLGGLGVLEDTDSCVRGHSALVYAALVGYLAWEGSARWIFVLGLIGAMPAAAGSWLSGFRARA